MSLQIFGLLAPKHSLAQSCPAGQYCAGSYTYVGYADCVNNNGVCVQTYRNITTACHTFPSGCNYTYQDVGRCLASVPDANGVCPKDVNPNVPPNEMYRSCCVQASYPPPPAPGDPVPPLCGNGVVDPGENCTTCPADAGSCNSFCGCIGCDRDESTWPGNGACIRTTQCGTCSDGQGQWWCRYPSDNYCPGEFTAVGGNVRDQNGQPLANIPMRLELHNGTNEVTYTNSNGYFVFTNLPQDRGYNVVPEWTRTNSLNLMGYTSAVTGSNCGSDFWCKNNATHGQVPMGSLSYDNQITSKRHPIGHMYGEDCGSDRCALAGSSTDGSGICNDPQVHPWPSGRHCNFVFNSYGNVPPTGYFHDVIHSRTPTIIGRWGFGSPITTGLQVWSLWPSPSTPPQVVYPGDAIQPYVTAKDDDGNLADVRVVRQKFDRNAWFVIAGTDVYYPSPTNVCNSGGSCVWQATAWTPTAADEGTWLYVVNVRDSTSANWEDWGLNKRCTGAWWAPPLSWSNCGEGSFFFVNVVSPPTYTVSGTIEKIEPLDPATETCTTPEAVNWLGGIMVPPNPPTQDPNEHIRVAIPGQPTVTRTDSIGSLNNNFQFLQVPSGTATFHAVPTVTANATLGTSYRLKCVEVPGYGIYNAGSGQTTSIPLNLTGNLLGVRYGYEFTLTYVSGWIVGYDGDVFGRDIDLNIPPSPPNTTYSLGMGTATSFANSYSSGVSNAKRAQSNKWASSVTDTFWPSNLDLTPPSLNTTTTTTITGLQPYKTYVITDNDLNALVSTTNMGGLTYTPSPNPEYNTSNGVSIVYVTGNTPININREVISTNSNYRILFITQANVNYGMEPTTLGGTAAQFALITSGSIEFPSLADTDTPLNIEGPIISANINTGGGDIIIKRNLQIDNATRPAVIVRYNNLYTREIRKFQNALRQYNVRWEAL